CPSAFHRQPTAFYQRRSPTERHRSTRRTDQFCRLARRFSARGAACGYFFRSQPEFTRPIWEYLDGALSLRRLARAEQLLEEHAPLLHRIEQYYGVDRQTL